MSKNTNFKNSYDEALFAYYVLRRLGTGRIDSFNQRLKSQKIQYFAQLFKVSPHYSFNLYIWGPYSPDFRHDLFEIRRKNMKVKLDKFIPKELEKRFTSLKRFIDDKSIRQLELVATLHWLLNIAHLSHSEAKKRLSEWKRANLDEIKYSFNAVSKI